MLSAKTPIGARRLVAAATLCCGLAVVSIGLAASVATADSTGYTRLEGHGGPIMAVAVSPGEETIATASFDYAVGIWSGDSTEHVRWLDGHRAAVNAAAWLPDGERLLTGSDDFDLILWHAETGKALATLKGHRGKVKSIAIAPDGRVAASAGWDGNIGLWDLEDRTLITLLEGHRGGVNDVTFNNDGSLIYSASSDGTVRSWSIAKQSQVHIESDHGFGINLVRQFEPEDGQPGWIAYGATDGVVRVVDKTDGAEIAALTGDRRPILALAISPDGRTLAYGDGEGYISVVNTEDWSLSRDFRATVRGPIWALAFVDDGRLAASGLDNFAAIWPVGAKGAPLFSDDGQRAFLVDPETVSNGERQFARKCSICHSLTPDSQRRAGPTLYGIFGRKAGSVPDYSYSPALADTDLVWTVETIDKLFSIGPDHYTPGSKMPMQQIADPADRDDLIAFLRDATAPESNATASDVNEQDQ
ncbi:MAG: c-type cytochrome [Pseudomonadota bacterium]